MTPTTATVLDAPINDIAGIRQAEAELERLKTAQRIHVDNAHPGINITPQTSRATNRLASQIGDLEKKIADAQAHLAAKLKANTASLIADIDGAVKTIQNFYIASDAITKVADRLKRERHPLADQVATAEHGIKIITNAGGALANLSRELKAAQG